MLREARFSEAKWDWMLVLLNARFPAVAEGKTDLGKLQSRKSTYLFVF